MRTPLLGAATVAVLAAGALATTSVIGSSHREAPRIMLDPSADNTDVYAFVAPDAPGKLTIVSNWIPLQNPAGGPYFGKLDPDRALLRQDRQHRRRRRGRRVPLAVQEQVPQPELVPVRGPAGQLDQRPEPQLRPDVRPVLRDLLPQRARLDDYRQIAQRPAGRARQRRAEDDAELRGGLQRRDPQPARRRQDVRRPRRRPVLRRPRHGLRRHQHRQARPPGDRARQPGRRQGRRLGLQHPLVRAAGADVRGRRATGGRSTSAKARNAVVGVWSTTERRKIKVNARGNDKPSGCRSAASATR